MGEGRMSKHVLLLLAAALVGCGNDPGSLGSGGNGGNGGGGDRLDIRLDAGRGTGGSGGGVSVTPEGQLNIVVRDFRLYSSSDSKTNPDFENVPTTDQNGNSCSPVCYGPWLDRDIVSDRLGADFKPVYKNPSGRTLTTHGKAAFDQWYNTVEGVNIMQQIPMILTRNPDGKTYTYDSLRAGPPLSPGGGFFPIDDGGQYATSFGNQGSAHNYSFTVEIHTVFNYHGGETFSFSGDDDVFVYIDGKLVINLGGIHGREEASIDIDSLGLDKNKPHTLDFFSAERHVVESNVKITTTLGLSNNADIPIF
jgi:fibro-slime domain-containing protein